MTTDWGPVPGVKRILITGNAGSGKTTLANQIAVELGLPYHCLDSIVWQERWRKRPDPDKQQLIAALIADEAWIIDGVSDQVMAAADIVVFLDAPRWVSAVRVVRRNAPHLFRSRPGMPPQCPEILVIGKLARLIRRFPTYVRPRILAEQQRRSDPTFVHVIWPDRLRAGRGVEANCATP